MEKAAAEIGFDEKFIRYTEENKDPSQRIKRGVGIACSMRGASIGADGMDVSRAIIEVEAGRQCAG